jgi:serine protein kinase
MSKLFSTFQENYAANKIEYMDLEDYLNLCKTNPMAYSTAAERMVKAIGEPTKIDTSSDPRLARIFMNRTIRTYAPFADFYGMEETIERIVGFFRHAAQGLEERKQILYLLGPVGSAKSSLAERLKELMEVFPIYVLCAGEEMSPVFETPLGLFPAEKFAEIMQKDYNIDKRYLNTILSPWAVKRLKSFNGDISKFRVAKVFPNRLEQMGIVKTEPGDDNNQDISSLVGKTDIRKLEHFSQNDPDSYSFSGALCRGNQGIVEMVEIFKSPIKMLHPLLTAVQELNFCGTEAISALPFNGMVISHSNQTEWDTFKANTANEAFIDRMCVIKVPYCVRPSEEQSIYTKMLSYSDLSKQPCAPKTLTMLAKFCVLTRLIEPGNSNLISKMRVYDGENLRDTDPGAKSITEYRDDAGMNEGMEGISTRFAFKVLSLTFNHDPDEVAADPVHLMLALETAIRREQFGADTEKKYISFIKEYIAPDYAEFIGHEIQTAYLESYDAFGQNMFDTYIRLSDAWCQDIDYRDPDTGNMYDREMLNKELEKIEKAANISNPKDFRSEVVNFVLRQTAKTGKPVNWKSYEKLKRVIEKRMFSMVEDILPVISFGTKKDAETDKKHRDFVKRMMAQGYSEKQVRRLVEWYSRVRKS